MSFLAARDFLLRHRDDYDLAYRDFRWPELKEFNWALDYFDAMARDNHRPALHVVDDDGGEETLTFQELSQRSNRVANFLRTHGVRRGDRILIMLDNLLPLWEITLAAMKLGVVADAASTSKFGGVRGDFRRIVVGGTAEGWIEYSREDSAQFAPDSPTRADDPQYPIN